MSTSVLVVDDSAMARKMLIAALPPSWDVSIRQASNGLQALEAYREGGVDVMFLDLTMPVMDGFQVLEHLKKEDMNCLVIVVSADIQPESQQRVKQLGAIAFMRKPINAEAVHAVLKEYGLAL
ncbi:response regulator [Aquabacterium sp.]|uniref:response regulator n=1 Tax=Aquabacterium sp. TaxID=1872578 RepID=UPI0024877DEB|nr:response regulator [Aquabacterium sp.]MDI1260008.1 response regulator [Aquabacterium sp.]